MPSSPAYLLDTGILIHYARASTIGQAVEEKFNFKSSGFKPVVCAVTLGEIQAFAQRRNWGPQKLGQLQSLLDNVVHVNIDSHEIIAAYADIDTYKNENGIAMGNNDV